MARTRTPRASQSPPAGQLVQFVPAEPGRADYDALADTLLAVADEVAAAEDQLLREAIAAIDAGDVSHARQILCRWQLEPPTEIVASLKGKKRCG